LQTLTCRPCTFATPAARLLVCYAALMFSFSRCAILFAMWHREPVGEAWLNHHKGVAKSFGAFKALHSIALRIAIRSFMVLPRIVILQDHRCCGYCRPRTVLGARCGSATAASEPSSAAQRCNRQGCFRLRVFPALTVFENAPLASDLRSCRRPNTILVQRAAGTHCTIEHLLNAIPSSLGRRSGSASRLARALAMEPDVS